VAVVVVTTTAFSQDPDALVPLTGAGHEVRFVATGPGATPQRVVEALAGASAVIAQTEPYTGEVLDRLPGLRVIARSGVGFDAVDVPAATQRGVLVTTTQGANDWAVADHSFALMLGLCHNILTSDRAARAGEWKRPVGTDLWEKTLGLVGLGRIGKGMVWRAEGFRMRVIAHEPYPDRDFVDQHGVELVSLEELMRRSDFISLHLPAMRDTYHIINAERLSQMKPTAYLVNTARGPLIDEAALEAALEAGQLAGAGLDVREIEPPQDTRFSRFDNVILTTHIAGVTVETLDAMSKMAVQSAADVLADRQPHGLINPEAWERRRGR
jgi:D-3-phosphoglycerate dehydrogenase / 2-oxoglutarate reductase